MKQQLQTRQRGKGYLTGWLGPKPDTSFAVLFLAAGFKRADSAMLQSRLGLSDDDARMLIDDLQRRYLIDIVSQLQGGAVVETIRLTEQGTSALQAAMERMCELPELG